MGDSDGSLAAADAFVFFGATGDLAHKMIFPALYRTLNTAAPDTGLLLHTAVISDSDHIAALEAGAAAEDPLHCRAVHRCALPG